MLDSSRVISYIWDHQDRHPGGSVFKHLLSFILWHILNKECWRDKWTARMDEMFIQMKQKNFMRKIPALRTFQSPCGFVELERISPQRRQHLLGSIKQPKVHLGWLTHRCPNIGSWSENLHFIKWYQGLDERHQMLTKIKCQNLASRKTVLNYPPKYTTTN